MEYKPSIPSSRTILEPLPTDSIPLNKRPCIPTNSTVDPEAGGSDPASSDHPDSHWSELLTRELTTSQLTYVPTRTDNDDTKLRYLLSANDRFHLTPTTKMLAQEWPLGLDKGELLAYGQRHAQMLSPCGTQETFTFCGLWRHCQGGSRNLNYLRALHRPSNLPVCQVYSHSLHPMNTPRHPPLQRFQVNLFPVRLPTGHR